MANPTTPAALTFIDDMSDADLDALLGMDDGVDDLIADEDAIAALREEVNPGTILTNAQIRAYGIAKPSESATVECALQGHRASRAEIAADIGARTFVTRPWMVRSING